MIYDVIGCFDWKNGVFQQTVVRIYYIFKSSYLKKNVDVNKASGIDNMSGRYLKLDADQPPKFGIKLSHLRDSCKLASKFLYNSGSKTDT